MVTSRADEKINAELIIEPQRIDSTHLLGFINAYLTTASQTRLDDSQLFESSRRLADLVTIETGITPLLAKLFADQLVKLQEANEPIQKLPRSVPDLMLAYLNSLNRNRREDDPDDPMLHRAAQIAAWECVRSTFRPGQPGSKSVIRDGLTEAKLTGAVLDYLEKIGVVKTDEPAKTHVRFELEPLSEYLAALQVTQSLAQDLQSWHAFFNDADRKCGAPESTRGFLLAIWDCSEAMPWERAVQEFIAFEISRRLALDVANVNRRRRRVEQLILYLTSSEPADRQYAVGQIRAIGPGAEAAVPALVALLCDTEPSVRLSTSEALVKIGVGAVPALIDATRHPEPTVRRIVTSTLGRLGPAARAALPALTELLSDPVPDVRCKAPGALVSIAGPETGVVLALIKALEGQDSAVRGESARALGRLGPAAQAAIPPLLEALRDPAVRWRAMKALSKIDPTRRTPAPLQIVGPNEADQSDRHATEMLTRMDPSAEGIAALITNLKHPRSGFRHRSAFILGEMGTNARPAIPALTEALKDPKSKVRRIAYAALRKLEVTQETEAKATLP